jgi:hypothetical protein
MKQPYRVLGVVMSEDKQGQHQKAEQPLVYIRAIED